jgi:PKD repeat protein
MLGCSTVTPELTVPGLEPGMEKPNAISPSPQNHNLWGFWWIFIDPATDKYEIVPTRHPELHLNIRRFLENGVPCANCLQIVSITPGPSDTKYFDIKISHPFPGNATLTGFDVRGVVMWHGSEVWPAGGLRTQNPAGPDGYVLNANGYTTIFNPTGFPPGSGPPILTYSQGTFATATAPNSTLNPYIDFWTSDNRHMFRSGESATRTYQIRYPTGGGFALGYAIDVCWDTPSPSPPVVVPDDFPLKANRPEPYRLEVLQSDPLYDTLGSHSEIQVRAWDWQLDPGSAWIECPDLWLGKKFHASTDPSTGGLTFHIPVDNETGAAAGTYRALIGIQDSTAPAPPLDYTSYVFFDIEVLLNPCCANPPVANFQVPPQIMTGTDVILTSISTDPDGPDCDLDLHWDLNGDGNYTDAEGQQASITWTEPGVYQVGLTAEDPCQLSDAHISDITVHAGVTQAEDIAAKALGMRSSYLSADMPVSSAAYAVDLNDMDGPWNFTALPLTDLGNYTVTLDKDDPECAGFKDMILSPYVHFFKAEGTYVMSPINSFDKFLYLAENYVQNPDRLKWVGLNGEWSVGPANLIPAIEFPFPFWVFSSVENTTDLGGVVSFSYKMEGLGEGIVVYPYDTVTTKPCILLRYQAVIATPSYDYSGICYSWMLDDGTQVAEVAAVNIFDDIQWDVDTGQITGNASFNALNEIVPY